MVLIAELRIAIKGIILGFAGLTKPTPYAGRPELNGRTSTGFLIARSIRHAWGRSPSLCQDGVEICIALAMEELLVGTKSRHPVLNLFPKSASVRHRRSCRLHNLDGPLDLFDVVHRCEGDAGFSPSVGVRHVAGNRTNKRHRLRD